MKNHTTLTQLVEIMETLRHPDKGCSWDLKQSYHSLLPMTFEEMTELADAVTRNDAENICEELGDILFHLVFYARIAEEKGDFTIQAVIDTVAEKMIRRHPHIFSDKVYRDAAEQKADWERIKLEEKKDKLNAYPHLSELSKIENLSSIPQSLMMQSQLAKMGFDWKEASQVWQKIYEEIDEVKQEIRINDAVALEEEFGDLLFTVLNLGRKLDIDSDLALRKANHKFYQRCEKMITKSGSIEAFSSLNLKEKEALWELTKQGKQ